MVQMIFNLVIDIDVPCIKKYKSILAMRREVELPDVRLEIRDRGKDGAADTFAQDIGPINTERPSFSSSPLALPTDYWRTGWFPGT